jgi:hypothetical protein
MSRIDARTEWNVFVVLVEQQNLTARQYGPREAARVEIMQLSLSFGGYYMAPRMTWKHQQNGLRVAAQKERNR